MECTFKNCKNEVTTGIAICDKHLQDYALTPSEQRWVDRVKKTFDSMPPSLKVYVLDDTAIVCKLGVSCNVIGVTVGRRLRPTNMLEDVHDDMSFGQY